MITLYCPPKDTHKAHDLHAQVLQAADLVLRAGEPLIIAGDFNAKLLEVLGPALDKIGLRDVTGSEPTRHPQGLQQHAPSKLDAIYTNARNMSKGCHVRNGPSDHSLLLAQLQFSNVP